jgi:LacI family transcriptional regulator
VAVASKGIKDVAARAGVSVGTVSNVLNRPHLVSEATRARVQAAIIELGFVRNESARQLRAGRSRTIAYVVLDAGNPFFTDVARGVEEIAKAHDLALMLCNSDHDAVRERDYLDQLLEQRVRGVLITALDYSSDRLRRLPERGVPVILVDRAPVDADDWCTVGVEDVEGGDLAVTHLIDQGHRRIAFAGGPPTILQVADRLTGARRAIEQAGLPPEALTVLETVALNVAEGRRVGERIIGLPTRRRPTAVFCANDLVALGVLQHMTQHGIAVPDTMAIVGYDDIEFAAAAAVPLTSVHQPRHLLGRAAVELLLEEAEAPPGHEHKHVQFSPELIVRASSTARAVGRVG